MNSRRKSNSIFAATTTAASHLAQTQQPNSSTALHHYNKSISNRQRPPPIQYRQRRMFGSEGDSGGNAAVSIQSLSCEASECSNAPSSSSNIVISVPPPPPPFSLSSAEQQQSPTFSSLFSATDALKPHVHNNNNNNSSLFSSRFLNSDWKKQEVSDSGSDNNCESNNRRLSDKNCDDNKRPTPNVTMRGNTNSIECGKKTYNINSPTVNGNDSGLLAFPTSSLTDQPSLLVLSPPAATTYSSIPLESDISSKLGRRDIPTLNVAAFQGDNQSEEASDDDQYYTPRSTVSSASTNGSSPSCSECCRQCPSLNDGSSACCDSKAVQFQADQRGAPRGASSLKNSLPLHRSSTLDESKNLLSVDDKPARISRRKGSESSAFCRLLPPLPGYLARKRRSAVTLLPLISPPTSPNSHKNDLPSDASPFSTDDSDLHNSKAAGRAKNFSYSARHSTALPKMSSVSFGNFVVGGTNTTRCNGGALPSTPTAAGNLPMAISASKGHLPESVVRSFSSASLNSAQSSSSAGNNNHISAAAASTKGSFTNTPPPQFRQLQSQRAAPYFLPPTASFSALAAKRSVASSVATMPSHLPSYGKNHSAYQTPSTATGGHHTNSVTGMPPSSAMSPMLPPHCCANGTQSGSSSVVGVGALCDGNVSLTQSQLYHQPQSSTAGGNLTLYGGFEAHQLEPLQR